jgi:hypothetical protein
VTDLHPRLLSLAGQDATGIVALLGCYLALSKPAIE